MTHRGYIGQVFEVRPILARMEDRGMPIDDAARVALDAEFEVAQDALGVEISALAPPECLRLHPKTGYKGVPPQVREWLGNCSAYDIARKARDAEMMWAYERRIIEVRPRFKDPDTTKPDGTIDEGEWYYYDWRTFFEAGINESTGEAESGTVYHWCRVYDFNPNSRNQVIEYMKAKGHPIPKDKHRENTAGESPETTNEKELRRLANKTGDTFYLKVIEYRGYTKMRGTYVEGFRPNPATGCVHTTFKFDTGIGQLASANPNIQNFPKLKPTVALAKAMRKMVAAKPGKILTEWDFKSCHVITLGFLAEDLNYMRLGRLDIHSFVAGHFLNLWDGFQIFSETDEQLRARFKWLKSDPDRKRVRDDQAKHGILGIGNGLKAKGLFERYMESFPPVQCGSCGGSGRVAGARGTKKCSACNGVGNIPGSRVAERVLETCEALFPNVFAYQKAEAQRAHDARQLTSQFGHIRRFYEVFQYDSRKGGWTHGDQHEQAVAFRLANIAFGHIREKMKELEAAGLNEKYGLFDNVHDSFMFHFDEWLLEEHIREVHPILTSPSKVLRHPTICPDGLVIDVEGAWGRNWADMCEITLPKAPVVEVPSQSQQEVTQ